MSAFALPLVAILAMQSTITMGSYGIPVIAPDAAADLGMAREHVGFLVSTIYLVAMTTGLATGVLIARLGPTRVFQLMLASVSAGAALLISGGAPAAFAGAVLIGLATGPMNPAGSHVLARTVPPRWRALAFSLKQCGTPAGGMLAGALLPPLLLAFDWRLAFAVVPATALVLVAVAPLGGLGAREPGPGEGSGVPTSRGVVAGTADALRIVLVEPRIRAVALTGACLAACQLALSTYLVLYLRDVVAMAPAVAGATFAVLHVSGVAARIGLGLVADRAVAASRLLVALAAAMAAGLVLIALFSSHWPAAAVLAVIALTGASGNGWVGLFFLELAKLSPQGRTAEVAGGAQFVMYGGIVAGPLALGALLGRGLPYQTCIALLAALAAGAALGLGRRLATAPAAAT